MLRRTLSDAGAAIDRDDDRVPEQLGNHRVVGILGHGATSVVYEAIDGSTDTHIAIKAIRGQSPDSIVRFKREFRSLADISHPNVVNLYELGLHQDQLYFTMELIRGCNLVEAACGPPIRGQRDLYTPCGDRDHLCHLFRQLVDGLCAIHDAGFLHRDIKPSNIMVATRENRVVLLDFGLVRDAQLDKHIGATSEGWVGTPLYMSPELAGGKPIAEPSDWYGVGEVLYHALTGRPPYHGVSMLGLLSAKRYELPPAPRDIVKSVPPDLDELCMQLLARDPAARPTPDVIVRSLGGTKSTATPSEDPFLGRDDELDRLEAALSALQTEAPVLAFAEGPSGIGKTLLCHEFLERHATDDDLLVLTGRCSERETIPFNALDPIIDKLCGYLRGRADEEEAPLPWGRDAAELSRLFPVLRSLPGLPDEATKRSSELDPAEARRRAVDALRQLLHRIATKCRLVVHIDDLQWADTDSLAVLDAMFSHPQAPPLLLLATIRSGAVAANGPLAKLVDGGSGTARRMSVHRISLGALPTNDARDLARRILGSKDNRLATRIAEEAEGNPLFVVELARTGRIEGSQGVVADLDTLLAQRLESLPASARRLLQILALAGGRLPGRVLRELSMLRLDSQAQVQLRRDRLIRTGDTEGNSLELYHDRIRQAALASIDTTSAAELHASIARALLATGESDDAALSHHFSQAGEEHAAYSHTVAAAERAESALAFDRAAELYGTALQLGVLTPEEHTQLQARRAEALANAGRLRDAAHAYLRAAERATGPNIEWRRRAAEHLLTSGHAEEGRAVLRDVLNAVGSSLPPSQTRAIATLFKYRALLSASRLRYRLKEAAEIPPKQLQRLDVCWTASRGLIYTDGLLGAAFHAQHLHLALRSGDAMRIARALGAEAHFTAGMAPNRRREKVAALLDEAEGVAERAQTSYARCMVTQARGHVALMQGDFRVASEELDKAVASLREHSTGVSAEIAYCSVHGAIALFYLGRIRELAPRAHELLHAAVEQSNPYVEGFARGLLGNLVHLAADRVDEAAEQLEIYRRTSPPQLQAHRLNFVCQSAALERYRGAPLQAWMSSERDRSAVERLDLLRSPQAQAEFDLWRAQCALAGAEEERSNGSLLDVARTSGTRLTENELSYARAYGHLVQGGVAALRGDQNDACRNLRHALSSFERHHMDAFATATRHRLAQLIEGSEADEFLEQCERWYAAEGVVRPHRLVRMIAPGFRPRADSG